MLASSTGESAGGCVEWADADMLQQPTPGLEAGEDDQSEGIVSTVWSIALPVNGSDVYVVPIVLGADGAGVIARSHGRALLSTGPWSTPAAPVLRAISDGQGHTRQLDASAGAGVPGVLYFFSQ